MRNYDFNQRIDWQEFQMLACEIIQRRETIKLQTYKAGPDDGVDGLWFEGTKKLIVQAKHYSKFDSLYSELKNSEIQKVKKLNPERYILIVSLQLSKAQADKIYGLFKGYINRNDDLITAKELNHLLSDQKYRDIEMQYKNLWLTDVELMTDILRDLFSDRQKSHSTFECEKVLKTVKIFVSTKKYYEALKQLNTNHSIIISGEPGMGKTTIARMLAFEFLEIQGMREYVWAESLEDIERHWKSSHEKQVFILDDFWGSVFYDENKRKATRRLEDLIYRFREEDNKRLIITSREYIVQQEIFRNPGLREVIEDLKLECILKDYSDSEKAKILFSHLEASDLEYEYVRELFYSCDRIVYHQGYSPRLIEKFLKIYNYKDYSVTDYLDELLGYLDYPEDFWKEIFKELSEEARLIAMILGISYTPISLEDIRSSYSRYIQFYVKNSGIKSFETCISELEKTLVSTYWDEEWGDIRIVFDNPSILDFIYSYLNENQEYYVPILCKISNYYNQLLALVEHVFYHSRILSSQVEKRCIEEFYMMPMKLQDYGGPELGEKYNEDNDTWSGRAFHLIRTARGDCFDGIKNFIFDYILHFFEKYKLEDRWYSPSELIDFVGLVGGAERKGLHFDGQSIMKQYLNCCQFASCYEHFESFTEIYPTIFKEIEEEYSSFMRKNIKRIILESLDYFEEFDYMEHSDMLMTEVPELLKKYNLRYTQKYKNQIKEITGTYYEKPKRKPRFSTKHKEYKMSPEEEDYEKIKKEAYKQLFGDTSFELQQREMHSMVKKMNLSKVLEKDLCTIIQEKEPWYIYEILKEEQALLVVKWMNDNLEVHRLFGEAEGFFSMVVYGIVKRNSAIVWDFLNFCTSLVEVLIYKEYPILTKKNLIELPFYQAYVEGKPEVEEVIYTYVLSEKGKWVEVRNEPLLLCCYCFVILKENDSEWEFPPEYGITKYIKKSRYSGRELYYPDFGQYVNFEWEEILLKLFKEMNEEWLYSGYVIPKLREFLDGLNSSEDRVLEFLDELKWEVNINYQNQIEGGGFSGLEAVDLLEVLENIELDLYGFEPKEIECLIKQEKMCKIKGKRFNIQLYLEKDVTVLKECGVYRIIENYLDEVEQFVAMF